MVSPHRTQRPWQGQVDEVPSEKQPPYDPACYLCPGNERAGGVRNPQYKSTYVFDNDFPALRPDAHGGSIREHDLIVAEPERGICRVACFSPRHDLTLSKMSEAEIRIVVDTWADQFQDLASRDFVQYVQIFENRGAMMGASNPHPHCQIWGTASIPNQPAIEQRSMQNYLAEHNACMLCRYLEYESSRSERVILSNETFTVVVPFWAVWPFETLVICRRHLPDMAQLTPAERAGLADVLKRVTSCYDQVFKTAFPYTMGFHQQPTTGEGHPEWHLHAHFYPPLLRSAGIRKFMVGFEMLGSPQRDITPEAAAERLREAYDKIGGRGD